MFPSYIWSIPTANKHIFLTFDDGPIPEVTDFVLDTLKMYNAKATFFCVGDNVKKHPSIYQRVKSEGHLTANHTFNHLKGWRIDNSKYFENIIQCDDHLDNETKNLFRPPYGQISPGQTNHLKLDYKIIMWDVLTCDYDPSLSAKRCLNQSIKHTKKGSIVVFHDSVKSYEKIKLVLPAYLEHFKKEGYSFKSLAHLVE